MASSVYSRALRKAAELLGGRDKLARHLGAPQADIDKWIVGEGKPPLAVFLRVIDYIIDETPPPADSSEPVDSTPPRDCSSADQYHSET